MVGVGAGAGAVFGVGAASVGAGAVFAVGAAAVGAGAVAFAVNTGENCGGPVFFDGFVFWRAFLPVAWSLRRRSCRAGEPLLMFDAGDAAFLPPEPDVGRAIVRSTRLRGRRPRPVGVVVPEAFYNQVVCVPWLPEARHALFWYDSKLESQNPSVSIT